MVELVADDGRLGGQQRRQHPHRGGVGGAEDHPRLAAVEAGQPALELDVLGVGAADEAHRAGAGAQPARRLLLGRHHLGAQRHAQIAVGVHAQEGALALAGEQEPRSALTGRRLDAGDDVFRPLGGAAGLELGELGGQHPVQSIAGHRRYSPLPGLRGLTRRRARCRSPSRASISRVVAARSHRGRQPHSSRAAESSIDSGQESAMAWRTGSTS